MASPSGDFDSEVDWAIIAQQEYSRNHSDMQIDEESGEFSASQTQNRVRNQSRTEITEQNEDEQQEEIDVLSQRVASSLNGSQGSRHPPRSHQSSQGSQRSHGIDPSRFDNPQDNQDEDPNLDQDRVRCSQASNHSAASSNSMFSAPQRNRSDRDDQSDIFSESSQPDSAHPSRHILIANYRLPDSIFDCSRFSFPFQRYWDPRGHLIVDREVRNKLYSQSKMLGIVDTADINPLFGVKWSFVGKLSGLGLSDYLMSVIYFFNIIKAMSQHHPWNGFVTATNNLKNNLQPRYTPGKKDIDGVVCGTMMDDQPSSSSVTDSRVLNLDKLLDAGERGSSGMVFQALPLLEINVGFTGATYTVNGKQERCLFGVVTVSWLLNVDFMSLFLVSQKVLFIFLNMIFYNYPQLHRNLTHPCFTEGLPRTTQGKGKHQQLRGPERAQKLPLQHV